MAWLKRNLVLVVGGLIALALLGVGGYYTWEKLAQDRGVTEELTLQTDTLMQLVNRPVHPGNEKVDNIEATRKQAERITKEVLEPMEKRFVPIDLSNRVNSAEFQLSLVATIAELRRAATNAGVRIPYQYAFSFSAQERTLRFDTNSLQPLSMQLQDVRMICDILYRAKVHRIDIIQRAPVGTNETDGADYLASNLGTVRTNPVSGTVTVPYRVNFVGHSMEIANVLDGFAHAPEFCMVKIVGIDPAPDADDASGTPGSGGFDSRYGPISGGAGGMDPAMAQRYGLAPGGPSRAPAMDPAMAQRYGLGAGGARGGAGARGGMGGRYGAQGGGGGRYGGNRYAPPPNYGAAPADPTQPGATPTGPVVRETALRASVLLEIIKMLPPGAREAAAAGAPSDGGAVVDPAADPMAVDPAAVANP